MRVKADEKIRARTVTVVTYGFCFNSRAPEEIIIDFLFCLKVRKETMKIAIGFCLIVLHFDTSLAVYGSTVRGNLLF